MLSSLRTSILKLINYLSELKGWRIPSQINKTRIRNKLEMTNKSSFTQRNQVRKFNHQLGLALAGSLVVEVAGN